MLKMSVKITTGWFKGLCKIHDKKTKSQIKFSRKEDSIFLDNQRNFTLSEFVPLKEVGNKAIFHAVL